MSEGKKILLIEDDPFMVRMYQTKFENDGYDVKTAFNGEEGLDLAEKELPNVILLDIMMPQMDGFEVLKKLKANSKTRDIPVFLLTNLGGEEQDIQKGKALGAEDYLVKSRLQPKEVIDRIKEVLER